MEAYLDNAATTRVFPEIRLPSTQKALPQKIISKKPKKRFALN